MSSTSASQPSQLARGPYVIPLSVQGFFPLLCLLSMFFHCLHLKNHICVIPPRCAGSSLRTLIRGERSSTVHWNLYDWGHCGCVYLIGQKSHPHLNPLPALSSYQNLVSSGSKNSKMATSFRPKASIQKSQKIHWLPCHRAATDGSEIESMVFNPTDHKGG